MKRIPYILLACAFMLSLFGCNRISRGTPDVSDVGQPTATPSLMLSPSPTTIPIPTPTLTPSPMPDTSPTQSTEPTTPAPALCYDGGTEIIPPHKTVYYEGEILDLTGLEVYSVYGTIYDDGTNIAHKSPADYYTVDLADKPLTVDDKVVIINGSWSYWPINGSFDITVLPAPTPTPTP